MFRLEGDSLPTESRGQIVPYGFGDVLLDVPGIPLQIGFAATLADNCGVDDAETTLLLSGPDLGEIIAALEVPLVAQIDNEWVRVTGFLTNPYRMVVDARGFGGTTAAVHAKGATVLFIESRVIYVFLDAPPGLRYMDAALIQLRANDVAQTPPCIFRLQDTRIVAGARFITAEFDLRRYFGGVTTVQTPRTIVFTATAAGPSTSGPSGTTGPPGFGFTGGRMRSSGSLRPNIAVGFGGFGGAAPPPAPPPAPTSSLARPSGSGMTTSRVVTLRESPLGRVSADLRGLVDTVGGRYTGVASGQVTVPADVARVKMEATFGQLPSGFHESSWLATRASQVAAGLTWRSLWYGDAFDGFRAAAGFCGLSDIWLDDSGLWRNTWQDRAAEPVAIVTARELVGEMALGFIPPSATRLAVTWGDRLQAGAFTLESPVMQARYGIITERSLALPFVGTETAARTVAQHWLAAWDHARLTGSVGLTHWLSDLTRTDHVMLETDLVDLYGARRVPWEIRATTDRGDQRVAVLIEGDPTDEVPMLWMSGDGAPDAMFSW